MEFHSTAPVRLDLAGGWTDVAPFAEREGGLVVNAAVQLSVHVELRLGGNGLRLESRDQGLVIDCPRASDLVADGQLDLHKAALRMFPVQHGCQLATWSDIPAGSGLGSSGALDVALVAVLARVRGERMTERELAEHAWHLETVEAGIPGGKQDQYAAALGGFNRLSFHGADTGIEPITLDPGFAAELERQTLLCYTGRSRISGTTIARVMDAYQRGDGGVRSALQGIKEAAQRMGEALRGGDLAKVGGILAENWRHQQALDSEMSTPEMRQLERAMQGAGLLGGKAAGSGAGGCMFFIVRTPDIAKRAALELGATVLPVSWATEGARAW